MSKRNKHKTMTSKTNTKTEPISTEIGDIEDVTILAEESVTEEMTKETTEDVAPETENENKGEISEVFETDGAIPQEKEETPERVALFAFAEFWNKNPHRMMMSDAEARQVHKWWQVVFHRTDYYVKCDVCSRNHVKQLKGRAKNEGIEIQ